jgi:membrane-bound lytic murein transglycosylase B
MKRLAYAFFVQFFVLFSFGLAFSPFAAEAQVTTAPTVDPCLDTTSYLPGETTAGHQARLTTDLAGCEAEETQAQTALTQAQSQSQSLQSNINVLTAQIKVAQINIQAKNLLIASLGKQISDKKETVAGLITELNQGKDTLAELVRKIDQLDQVSLPEIFLSDKTLTQALSDYDTFSSLNSALQSTAAQLSDQQTQTQNAEDSLTTQQNQQEDALATIQQDQAKIKQAQAAKAQLLTVSKGNESAYTQLVAQKAAKAASIRTALFNLAGGGQAIPFGTALSYAQEAQQEYGIDPAFLLAILTQESSLGSNVGKCYLSDTTTGAGTNPTTGKTYPNVMKPSRDIPPFLSITSSLGLDPLKTVVSCPIAGAGGYGGAMGPAQFIPSTWALLETRLASALGVATPDPWAPRDAFIASAIFLSDLGARSSYSSELRAACSYYGTAGGTCAYGRSVMSHANTIQTSEIDPLQGL